VCEDDVLEEQIEEISFDFADRQKQQLVFNSLTWDYSKQVFFHLRVGFHQLLLFSQHWDMPMLRFRKNTL